MTAALFTWPLRFGPAIPMIIIALAGCGMNNNAESTTASTSNGESAPILAGQANRGVTVTVRLSPELRAKAAPDNALYIFARAAQGPAMPLYVPEIRMPYFARSLIPVRTEKRRQVGA